MSDTNVNFEPPTFTADDFAGSVDHSLLAPTATLEQIRIACETAKLWKTAAMSVRPSDVTLAAELLKGSKTVVSTPAGFPHGTTSTAGKMAEIRQAAKDGCKEVALMINQARLLSGDMAYVKAEVATCAQQAQQAGMKICIIFETVNLSPRQIIELCHICQEAKVDSVETSTGFATGGANTEDIVLMRGSLRPEIAIKASGGIRNLDRALELIAAGASRIGTSATIAIIEEAKALDREGKFVTLWESIYRRIKRSILRESIHILEDPGITQDSFYCPLLEKEILETLCISITYAVEGRFDRAKIQQVDNWSRAERLCADCANAYWNRSAMPAPKLEEPAEI